ncbi:hypothetical protein QBC43DRAFT_283286 [Cladorrhinum sp. PSN259]|nr:hypothetical protein QBC43DRAFT_283286 [Cladorrhinum sp. PSN259]
MDNDTTTTIILDRHGDLVLSVGASIHGPHARHDFRVCSSTLRRTSPVFERMLFGPWTESKPKDGQQWVVSLPEDDQNSMQVVLVATHCQYCKIPIAPSADQLKTILVCADKYGMAAVLRPWRELWAGLVKSWRYDVNRDTIDFLNQFYLAWELGERDTIERMVGKIVYAALEDDKGHLLIQGMVKTTDGPVAIDLTTREYFGPADIPDIIANARFSLIQALLDFYHEQRDNLMGLTGSTPACAMAAPRSDPTAIRTFVASGGDGINTRSTFTTLAAADVYMANPDDDSTTVQIPPTRPTSPVLPKDASKFLGRAEDLIALLEQIFTCLPIPGHENCVAKYNWMLREMTYGSDRWTKGWLTGEHEKRLKERRVLLGVHDT